MTAPISRLAYSFNSYVLTKLQGQGLGGQLLTAAARRCLRVAAEVGGVILIIDAKSERAAAWYASYDAVPLADKPLTPRDGTCDLRGRFQGRRAPLIPDAR